MINLSLNHGKNIHPLWTLRTRRPPLQTGDWAWEKALKSLSLAESTESAEKGRGLEEANDSPYSTYLTSHRLSPLYALPPLPTLQTSSELKIDLYGKTYYIQMYDLSLRYDNGTFYKGLTKRANNISFPTPCPFWFWKKIPREPLESLTPRILESFAFPNS